MALGSLFAQGCVPPEMITLDNSIRRIGQFLRPQDGLAGRAARRAFAVAAVHRLHGARRPHTSERHSAGRRSARQHRDRQQSTDVRRVAASGCDGLERRLRGRVVKPIQDGSGWGVYAQLFDSAGAAQGSEILVNTATANDQQYASVAMAPGGGLSSPGRPTRRATPACARVFNPAALRKPVKSR